MDSNKSRVNWRQAGGEALLIFLGVGLALAGQAWWDYRDDRQIEEHLLIGLQEDLGRDTVDVNRVIFSARGRIVGANRLLELLDDPAAWGSGSSPWPAYVDSLVGQRPTVGIPPWRALQMVSALGPFQTVDISNASYAEAVATGQLDVIRDTELRSHIVDYYSVASTGSRTTEARTEAQWHRLSAALAAIGVSPEGQGSEESLLAELRRNPTVIAELKNARGWAVQQARYAPDTKRRAEALLVELANGSGT